MLRESGPQESQLNGPQVKSISSLENLRDYRRFDLSSYVPSLTFQLTRNFRQVGHLEPFRKGDVDLLFSWGELLRASKTVYPRMITPTFSPTHDHLRSIHPRIITHARSTHARSPTHDPPTHNQPRTTHPRTTTHARSAHARSTHARLPTHDHPRTLHPRTIPHA